MNKHPNCADHCQILEHKGYHDCTNTGRCELLEAMNVKTLRPEQISSLTLKQCVDWINSAAPHLDLSRKEKANE